MCCQCKASRIFGQSLSGNAPHSRHSTKTRPVLILNRESLASCRADPSVPQKAPLKKWPGAIFRGGGHPPEKIFEITPKTTLV